MTSFLLRPAAAQQTLLPAYLNCVYYNTVCFCFSRWLLQLHRFVFLYIPRTLTVLKSAEILLSMFYTVGGFLQLI